MFNILVIDDNEDGRRKLIEIAGNGAVMALTFVGSVEEAVKLMNPAPVEVKPPPPLPTPAAPAAEVAAAPVETPPEPAAPPPPPPPTFHLILLDSRRIESAPVKGILELRESIKESPSANAVLCLLSHDKDPDYIRRFLLPGVTDVLVKPVLTSAMNALVEMLTGAGLSKSRPSKPVQGSAELYFEVTATEISEFDMQLSAARPVAENEFKSICGPIFQWVKSQRVIARCMSVEEDAATKGFFNERFSFIGVQPGLTKELRVWLKNEHIKQKQQGEGEG